MLSRSELLAAIPQRQIWLVDFEFQSGPGERPIPICLVAHELRSIPTIHLCKEDFGPTPPYPTSEDSLFIAFYASPELGCHAALGWEMPRRILDLFVEFRAYANGLPVPAGNSLLAALSYFGLE